ncbi:hypothetical protein ACET3X_005006 [Alternaria dauci]|uniref:Uncharacterized protein n=1 Tax=Alternaria dauci TaxID=48095 RepID=A0ABR3UJ14_9PLEO
MLFKRNLLLSFVGLTSVIAAPTNPEDLECRCLAFSTSAAPTLCSYQELLVLDWDTAYSLATVNDLKIQFASDYEESMDVEVHYVGIVLGLFMLLVIIYLIGDYLWTRYLSRAGSI